jgi:DNA polymerase III delta subunit
MESAARRLRLPQVTSLLHELARLDALSKGIGRGDVWDELRTLALQLAGKPLPHSLVAR